VTLFNRDIQTLCRQRPQTSSLLPWTRGRLARQASGTAALPDASGTCVFVLDLRATLRHPRTINYTAPSCPLRKTLDCKHRIHSVFLVQPPHFPNQVEHKHCTPLRGAHFGRATLKHTVQQFVRVPELSPARAPTCLGFRLKSRRRRISERRQFAAHQDWEPGDLSEACGSARPAWCRHSGRCCTSGLASNWQGSDQRRGCPATPLHSPV